MVVKKLWYTITKELEPGYSTIYHNYRRDYIGWFLFGIIPLYVKQTSWQVE